MRRLLDVAELPDVTLQVAPFSVGGHAGMDGPFAILSFPDRLDPGVVYIESTTGDVRSERPSDVQSCAEIAFAAAGAGVRDSKNRAAGALRFDAEGWARFVGAAKSGDFDLTG
jgi:hypothetical protein